VGDVGVDEVLFSYGFVEQILKGSVEVALVVWSHYFFCELSEQGGWKVMKCQVDEEVIFCGHGCCFLIHARSLGARGYGIKR
jgi:hypothetical protein